MIPDDPRRETAGVKARPSRVLVAEDDDALRRLVAARLRRVGVEVVEARDGHEALERVATEGGDGSAQGPIDLVISDVKMPGLGGLQVIAWLRAAGWSTPVILITAFGSAETHEAARRLGARAIFDKPFDLDELVGAVLEGGAP